MSDNDFQLFAELIKQPRPHIIVDFPLTDSSGAAVCQIGLVTLNNQELMDAKAGAQRTTNLRMKGETPEKGHYAPGYESIYEDALAGEILFRCCKNPADLNRGFFPGKQDVYLLSNDQLGVLVNHYNHLVATRGPIISNMTNEEMDSLIERIAKDAQQGAFFLNSLTLEELKAFTTYAACSAARLSNSQTDSGSPGSPLEG